jgi:hypothetical protein
VAGLLLVKVLSSPRARGSRSGWPDRLHAEWPAGVPLPRPIPGCSRPWRVTVVEESDAVGVLVRVETALLVPGWKHSQAER